MRRPGRGVLIGVALALAAPGASGQLGEVQMGGLATYGLAANQGTGLGAVLGVAAGRIIYVGARWSYYLGNTEQVGVPGASVTVRNRVQVFAADAGILFPWGSLELVPGASMGWARYSQRVDANGQAELRHATKFVVAPGLAVHVPLAGLRVIPELQYYLADRPDLTHRVDYRGIVATVRVVITTEVGRIRF